MDKPDLRDVWESYGGQLQERREQQVVCLVHDEQRPSASVNLDDQVWNCHACGAGGDSYTLIMLKESCDFRAAVEIAEGRFGVSGSAVPEPSRRRGPGVPRGKGFAPRYRNAPVRGRPLSSA